MFYSVGGIDREIQVQVLLLPLICRVTLGKFLITFRLLIGEVQTGYGTCFSGLLCRLVEII